MCIFVHVCIYLCVYMRVLACIFLVVSACLLLYSDVYECKRVYVYFCLGVLTAGAEEGNRIHWTHSLICYLSETFWPGNSFCLNNYNLLSYQLAVPHRYESSLFHKRTGQIVSTKRVVFFITESNNTNCPLSGMHYVTSFQNKFVIVFISVSNIFQIPIRANE